MHCMMEQTVQIDDKFDDVHVSSYSPNSSQHGNFRRSGSLEASYSHRIQPAATAVAAATTVTQQRLTTAAAAAGASSGGQYHPHSGGGATAHYPDQRTSGQRMRHEYRLSGNLFIVLYDFIARHRDELDLKAGWKVSAIDTSDPDWWTGKCNGKVGFFPSAYVQRIRPGDQAWRVGRQMQLTDANGTPIKLFRGQIVIQVSQEEDDLIPIRLKDGAQVMCPWDSVSRILNE